MADRLWTPSAERVARAAMTAFRHAAPGLRPPARFLSGAARVVHRNPGSLLGVLRSIRRRLPLSRPTGAVISDDPMPLTRWFEGATLNYAQALLHPSPAVAPDAPAIIAVDEAGSERHSVVARRCADEVARTAAALHAGRHRPWRSGRGLRRRTSRRRSSSCSPAPRSAPSSARARPTSASTPPTRASIRSSRACWLHPTATCTTVGASTPRRSSTR